MMSEDTTSASETSIATLARRRKPLPDNQWVIIALILIILVIADFILALVTRQYMLIVGVNTPPTM